MATSSEGIEDSLSAPDVAVQNAVPGNRYTEEFDDIDDDELDYSQVINHFNTHLIRFCFLVYLQAFFFLLSLLLPMRFRHTRAPSCGIHVCLSVWDGRAL